MFAAKISQVRVLNYCINVSDLNERRKFKLHIFIIEPTCPFGVGPTMHVCNLKLYIFGIKFNMTAPFQLETTLGLSYL